MQHPGIDAICWQLWLENEKAFEALTRRVQAWEPQPCPDDFYPMPEEPVVLPQRLRWRFPNRRSKRERSGGNPSAQ